VIISGYECCHAKLNQGEKVAPGPLLAAKTSHHRVENEDMVKMVSQWQVGECRYTTSLKSCAVVQHSLSTPLKVVLLPLLVQHQYYASALISAFQ